jgi:hypothetical protein
MNRWPTAITINLWPYALKFANDVFNATPTIKTGRTPLEAFSSTPVRSQILNFHPSFCPAYVLHNGLQGGGTRPNKWVRRSRVSIYSGFSPRHARLVALVLSLIVTGYVSPQFHMKFDDFFETVQEKESLPRSRWQVLSRFVTDTGRPTTGTPTVQHQGATTRNARELPIPPEHTEQVDFEFVDPGQNDEPEETQDQAPCNDGGIQNPASVEEPSQAPERPVHPEATRRSTRPSKAPKRLVETAYAVLDDADAVEDYETQNQAEDPIAFATSKSDPDTLHFNRAMIASDAAEFKQAMLKEANAHTDNKHWEGWAKADVRDQQDILPAVWAFKRKRRIDTREVYKHKARLNIHGGKQKHGINYWETYSPIVNWFSI